MKKTEIVGTVVRYFSISLWILVTVIGLGQGAPAQAQSEAPTAMGTSTEVSIETNAPVKWYESDWLSGEGVDAGDFVVGPGHVEVTIRPGETAVREITLTNRISDNRAFEFVVEDIAGGTDGASVQLLGEREGPYTLKDYISFPNTRVTLGLGERAKIPVTISIPPDAEPGGRYGSVLITTVQDDAADIEAGAPGTRSPVIARIGVLFFVTVPGETELAGETKGLSLIGNSWWYERGPVKLAIAYENTGSLHLTPYGELRITNMFGEEVGFMQLDPWFVLPKSLRTRELSWDREFLLGRYTATVAINRGYEDIVDERSVTFWVLPWKVIGGTFAIIFIIFFLFRTFFRTFEFKRKSS